MFERLPPEIPSMTISGSWLPVSVETPRNMTWTPLLFGSPEVVLMASPATRPCRSCNGEVTAPSMKSRLLTDATELVSVLRRTVP